MYAIKFREDFDRWQAGDVARLEPTLMQRLVDSGKAVEHVPQSTRVRDEAKPKKSKRGPKKRKVEPETATKI